ncbi:DUF4350 domain-containing protein [Streptomyces sodiiphilus]|uniref:DUF4350 domain-containing protein n=1 Tax=Streptomyces sodiiphilus TaxID=226217 RepID=A0ABN2PTU0_9ACTN
MTAPAAPPVPPEPDTPPRAQAPSRATSPDARHLWRRSRGPLLAAAVLALTGLLIALLRAGDSGVLHPGSATPNGSRAIAELLAARGVETTVVTSAEEAADAAGPDTTVLVTRPDAIGPALRRSLHEATSGSGGRTVLVAPGETALETFARGVRPAPPVGTAELEPGCEAEDAVRAGSVDLGGFRYEIPGPSARATGCYPSDGLPTLVTLRSTDGPGEAGAEGDTVLLGAPDILYNERLDRHGNASLAMQLLGTRPHLVWYLPSAADAPAADEAVGFADLIDPAWRWAALQLVIAVALAALWRARRLGPVVTERLPVVVRAAETTEGRARLYHRAGARDRAAEALRTATRDRLAPLVGVARSGAHSGEELLPALASRTGEQPQLLRGLLFGPAPADDAGLVRLADDLRALERRMAPMTTSATKDKDRSS